MSTRSIASAAILAVCLLLAGPSLAQQTEGDIGVGDGQVEDAAIERRIRDVIGVIGGYDGVEVTVEAGVVRLDGTVLDGASEEQLRAIATRVDGVVAVEDTLTYSADLAARLDPVRDRLKARLGALAANLPIFVLALVAAVATLGLGLWLARRQAFWERLAPNTFIAEIYGAVARLCAVVAAAVVLLEILNATALLGAVLGAAGVAGLAIGFAVRDTVENFIASVLLSLRQPFRPDDVVEIDGDLGSVSRLTSRATILISPDGNHIRIPNAAVFKAKIVNYTRSPNRRFTFTLGVDAEADHGAALATAAAAIEALPFVLADPPVSAWVSEVGDSNVILSFAGWLDQGRTDFLKGRGEAVRQAKDALEGAGFGLPEPIYRLKIDSAHAVLTETEETDRPAAARGVEHPVAAPKTPRKSRHKAAEPGVPDTGILDVAAQDRADARAEPNLLSEDKPTE